VTQACEGWRVIHVFNSSFAAEADWLARDRHGFRRLLLTITVQALRFAVTLTQSGCAKDFHLRAVEHARRTKNKGRPVREAFIVRLDFRLEEILQTELDVARALDLCTNGAEGGNVGEIRSRRCEANVV